MIEMIGFINSIPTSFGDVEVMTPLRKEYYLKTFALRLETFLKAD